MITWMFFDALWNCYRYNCCRTLTNTTILFSLIKKQMLSFLVFNTVYVAYNLLCILFSYSKVYTMKKESKFLCISSSGKLELFSTKTKVSKLRTRSLSHALTLSSTSFPRSHWFHLDYSAGCRSGYCWNVKCLFKVCPTQRSMQIDSDPTNRRDTVLNWKHSNSLSFFNSVEVIKQNIIIKLFEDYLLKQIKRAFTVVTYL